MIDLENIYLLFITILMNCDTKTISEVINIRTQAILGVVALFRCSSTKSWKKYFANCLGQFTSYMVVGRWILFVVILSGVELAEALAEVSSTQWGMARNRTHDVAKRRFEK